MTTPLSRFDNPNWFEMIPQMTQRQDATNEQLADLLRVANRLGLYDAADVIKAHMAQVPEPGSNVTRDLELRRLLYDLADAGDVTAGEVANRIGDLGREVEHWQKVAAYMASCHAATLEGLPKSAPKSHRSRLVSICTEAANALRHKIVRGFGYHRPVQEVLQHEADRCEAAVRSHAG